jgi:hypothetical protein
MIGNVRKALIVSLALLMIRPPSAKAAVVPVSHPGVRLGIVRVGFLGEEEERAYQVFERRVKRWLENLEDLPVKAEPLGALVVPTRTGESERAAKLAEVSEALLKELKQGTSNEACSSLASQSAALRQGLKINESVGVQQKALWAEAIENWKRGAREEARGNLREAISLHPDLEGAPSLWDWESSLAGAPSLEVEVNRLRKKIPRPCQLTFSVTPSNARISVNGLDFGERREFRVPLNREYSISLEKEGYRRYQSLFSCDRLKHQRAVVQLPPASKDSELGGDGLRELSRRHSLKTLCLIEPKKGGFNLYLYSPDVGLDPIPVHRPIRVADLIGVPDTEKVPIVTDAFLNLMQKHQSVELFRLAEKEPSPLTLDLKGMPEPSPQWYNNWKFWAIAGGIVGAATLAYFVTRSSPEIKSQETSVGIQIR